MQEFEGKVAVVTGAASGIGRGLAERFAQEGMRVVLADVEEAALDAAVLQLRRQEYDVLGVLTDVSRQDAVDSLAGRATEAYGKVHVLCNNAGVAGGSAAGLGLGLPGAATAAAQAGLWQQGLKDWQWVFGVNFWGVVHGLRAFLPGMLAHGEEGHVVNTASIMGLLPGGGIYGASKHAVVSISETLHTQLTAMNAKVKVSVLCPGGVRTRIASAARNRPDDLWEGGERPAEAELGQRDQMWAQRIQANSMEPEEVADKVVAALRAGSFYVLPHENDAGVRRRFEAILSRQGPVPLNPLA